MRAFLCVSAVVSIVLAAGLPAHAQSGPGGSSAQIQYNANNSFGGVPNFVWDGSHVLAGMPLLSLSPFAQAQIGHYSALTSAWNNAVDPIQFILDRDGSDTSAITAQSECYITSVVAQPGHQCSAFSLFDYATGSAEFGLLTGLTINNGYAGSSVLDESTGIWVAIPTNSGAGTINNSEGIDIQDQSGPGIAASDGLLIAGSARGGANYSIRVQRGANDLGPGQTQIGSMASKTNCDGSSISGNVTACGSAAFGMFIVPAGGNIAVIDTTAMHAESEVFVQPDSSIGPYPGVHCNQTVTNWGAQITGRAAGNFTVTLSSAPGADPACFSYMIVN